MLWCFPCISSPQCMGWLSCRQGDPAELGLWVNGGWGHQSFFSSGEGLVDKKCPISILVLGVWEDECAEHLVPVAAKLCCIHVHVPAYFAPQPNPTCGSGPAPETQALHCKHEAL